MSSRNDVVGAYRFMVELDGIFSAGFSEVSGLQAETEVEEYWEGGQNAFVHRLPKKTTYPPLVLKRGITDTSLLWDWYLAVVSGTIVRQTGSIVLLDQSGDEVCRWNFFDAYPVKWVGPELNASQSGVAIETVELVHNGIKAMFSGDPISMVTGLFSYD